MSCRILFCVEKCVFRPAKPKKLSYEGRIIYTSSPARKKRKLVTLCRTQLSWNEHLQKRIKTKHFNSLYNEILLGTPRVRYRVNNTYWRLEYADE